MTGKRFVWPFLLIVLVSAGVLRFWDLDARGIGHIEMYTPNIPLPAGISDPPPRLTLVSTLTGSLWEPHPPAWYLANYPWTRVFGVSPTAMRLPSVLMGVLGVFLLWRFASNERSQAAGLVAAAFLSVNGLHVMWSQLSRPVIFVATIGIASSIVLLRLAASPTNWRCAAYLCLSIAGLATDHYYWFLLGGQAVWVFLLSRVRPAHAPVLEWQFAAMAAASPLITLAVAQSRTSYLGSSLLETAANYTGFGFLFQTLESTYVPTYWLPGAAIALGGILAVAGLTRGRSVSADTTVVPRPGVGATWMLLIGATCASMAAAYVLSSAGMSRLPRLLATAILPAVFLVTSHIARRMAWPRLHSVPPLSVILCTVPVITVLAISTVMPFVDAKYFLLFTPFLLIQIADGLLRVFRASAVTARAGGLAAALLAAAVHWQGLQFYRGVDGTPIDFRALAREIRPVLGDTDKLLVYKHYAMTPVFYYLGLDASRYVAADHESVRHDGTQRFWMISLRDSEIADPPGYAAAVAGCEQTRTITARRIRAELYERCLRKEPDDPAKR